MNPHHQPFHELLLAFLFLSSCYIFPVGFTFLLKRFLARTEDPAIYSFKAFLYLCIPALAYALFEGFASRQGLNFLFVVPCMVTIGIVATILLRKLNVKLFAVIGSLLVIITWYTAPEAVIFLH